jgi:hypothetical protein
MARRSKVTAPQDAKVVVHTSVVLQQLHDEVRSDHVTLGWLMSRLRKRSYGMIMLVLALIAMVPGICIVAGLLLMIPAVQMIAGQPAPIFPRRIAEYPFPTRHFAALLQRSIPVLKYLERMTHPRWHWVLEANKRLVGVIIVILSSVVVLAPIPLTNIVPSVVIAVISLAYLEEDGLVLWVGISAAVIVLAIAVAVVWGTVVGVKWLGGL